jgi:photosystem II stability/assembly factor-like uncharacterized protein
MRALLVIGLASSLAAGPARAESWVPVGPSGGNVRALAADPRNPDHVYLGSADGMFYRSTDAGLNWRRSDPGFPLPGCCLEEIDVTPRGTVFVGYWEVHGSGGGVARSTDGGRSFTILKGIAGESVRALAISPSEPRVIAAGSLSGVFLSRDGGESWRRITAVGDSNLRNVESLAFDSQDPDVLYAGTWHLGWKTTDGGMHWSSLKSGMVDDSDVMTLNVDRSDPQILYATACTGVYRSTEGGASWTKLEGIPESSRRTRSFSLSPRDPNLLLAGTTEGLWVSLDRGVSWRLMTEKDVIVNALLVQPDGTILLGTEDAGVMRSSDEGRTWSASNTGFLERFVSTMQFDSNGRLLVAVWGASRSGGVFMTPDMHGPWTRLGDGLGGREVLSLAMRDGSVLAGTDDGIFVRVPRSSTWTRLPTRVDGLEMHPRVVCLVALPSMRLLAATSDGILRSADGGRSWTLGTSGEAFCVAQSGVEHNLVVAATRSGFFRSTDGGDTWTRAAPALDGVTPHQLSFIPSDDRVLLATTTSGLFRSVDQGSTWQRLSGGIPHSDLTGLAVHPDGRTIYASDFTRGGIFRSVDAGTTWTRMPTEGLASDRVWALALDPSAPEHVFAASAAGGLHMLMPVSSATGVRVEGQ